MFFVEAKGGSFDLDRLIQFLAAQDVTHVVSSDGIAISFPYNPSEIRIRDGIAVVDAVDLDQAATIIWWLVQSQEFPVVVLNAEDQIRVEVRPSPTPITPEDISAKSLPIGTDVTRFAHALGEALLSGEPWITVITNPKEKTGLWLHNLAEANPDLRGAASSGLGTRNIYIWSKRKQMLFSNIGDASALFWRSEPGSDVAGMFFQRWDILIDRSTVDEAEDQSLRYLFRGEIRPYGTRGMEQDKEVLRAFLLEFGRTRVNAWEDEIAIDLNDGVFSARTNGGFWVKVFHWNDGVVREEDRFVASQ